MGDATALSRERFSTELLTRIVSSDEHALGLSFGSPFIFRQVHIDTFKGNLLNSHGAPLPEFKGGGGFSWRILQGDKRGTSLMHLVTTKIDEGPIVFRKEFEFSKDDILPTDFESRQRLEDKISLLPWLKNLIEGSADTRQSRLTSRDYIRTSMQQYAGTGAAKIFRDLYAPSHIHTAEHSHGVERANTDCLIVK